MKSIFAKDISVKERQAYLTSGIGPRPIALVSSISETGIRNIAPFSFFNAFGANPPTVAFSPARRGRDGTLKDTYYNVKATKECAISMVSYDMVEQISLASSEYDSNIDEFVKSGLTPSKSDIIKPSGVAESPIWFECIVKDIIHTGEENGAGNIVICEIVVFHINENVLTNGIIDPHKADIVGRFGANDYVRASNTAIFEIPKPTSKGMGFDNLPDEVLQSHVLTANNLARLANMENLPTKDEVNSYWHNIVEINFIKSDFNRHLRLGEIDHCLAMLKSLATNSSFDFDIFKHETAKKQLDLGNVEDAWKTLMFY